MAFKVLNEEQIALLTDDQKKQYEKALDLYNERVAFVQRINVLENVRIPSYEPKLQEITVIDGIPASDYTMPELTVKSCVPAARPRPQYNVFELDGPINAVLPQFSKAAQVEVGHIKKVEAVRPELPEVVKVGKTAFSFTEPEKAETVLPETVKVEKVAISFEKSEKMQAVLPEITIGHTDIKEYKKPKLAQNKVPVVRKPEITVKSERLEPVCAVLPELLGVETADVKFTKPEISSAEVPTIPRPTLAVHVFDPVEYSVADLPDIREPQVKIEKIPSLKHRKNDRKPELPRVEKISVAGVVFKPVKTAEPKIPVTSILTVRVKPFAKVENRVKGMPELSAVTIPNAGERLKELLSTAFLPDNIGETEVEKSER